MLKTHEQVKDELCGLIDNHWKDIKEAYRKGAGVTVSLKVVMEPSGSHVAINPSVEFYPLPKYKSEKYTVLINENQLTLFPKEVLNG